jgi:hypothetical protein
MHKLTFFPIGNADSCRIDLSGGQKLLFDYAAMRCENDSTDRRIDLPRELRADLKAANRNHFEVVAFTHLDDDHIHGASEFFRLDHAEKYQGEGRIVIETLWVPAAVIIEDGCEDEARIIQAEARYRLKQGKGIRVFSRPDKLTEWLRQQNLSLADRQHLITDAGLLIPGYSLGSHGVEFFVHSPFGSRLEDGTLVDRNTDSLVLQATFDVDGTTTKLILSSDVDHTVLSEIVKVTRFKKRDERLEWDVVNLPHHCSYKSIGPEKGKDKTEPVAEVAWLFEDQGQDAAIVVSTSKPIPSNDDDDQPPHRQAANYHKDHTADRNGQFVVTMEHPSMRSPEPLVIEIGATKAKLKRRYLGGAAAAMSAPAPRVG